MSSLSIMDFLTDKLLSYSSKMKGDSSRLTGSSNLMSDNSKLFSLNLLNGLLGDSSFNSETSNLIIPMKQSFGQKSGNNSFSFFHSFKPLTHLFNAVMTDPYHFPHSSEIFVPPEKMLVSHIMNSGMSRPSDMNPSLNCGFIGQEMPLPSVKTETKVSVNLSLTKKKGKVASQCDLPNFSTLNKELTNRKTKEMHKRSRNRRRRRRKNQQTDCNKAASPSNDTINKVASSVTSLYLVSENPVFECTVSVSHPLQIASSVLSSFVIPVDSSDDDSDWESYDMNQCDVLPSKKGDNDISSVSSHIKSESVKSKPAQTPKCNFLKATNFKSTFVVPVCGSEDESDFDSSSDDLFHNLAEFQCTGLFVADFCSYPKTVSSKPEDSIAFSEDEETVKANALLREANKNWNNYDKGMNDAMKSKSQKVSFAPDDVLVEVFPADICERKGEWEIFATERLRFKRKIDELEKVISPCLEPKHRSKIFKRLNKSVL